MNRTGNPDKIKLASPKFQKQMQSVAALGALASCYERNTVNMISFWKMIEDAYHGNKNTTSNVSAVTQVLTGYGRFEGLWEEDKKHLKACFPGPRFIKAQFSEHSLRVVTLKKKEYLSGRNLTNKAQDVLKLCKAYLAIWESLLIMGKPPSGWSFEDVLTEVLRKLFREQLRKKKRGDTDEDEEEGKEVEQKEEEDEEEEDEDQGQNEIQDVDIDDEDLVVPESYVPPHFWAFAVFGPFSENWGQQCHHIISAGFNIDANKREFTREAKKQVEVEQATQERNNNPGRGMSDYQATRLENDRERIRLMNIDREIALTTAIQSSNIEKLKGLQMMLIGVPYGCEEYNELRAEMRVLMSEMTGYTNQLRSMRNDANKELQAVPGATPVSSNKRRVDDESQMEADVIIVSPISQPVALDVTSAVSNTVVPSTSQHKTKKSKATKSSSKKIPIK